MLQGWAKGACQRPDGARPLAAQNALGIQSRVSRGDTFIFVVKTHVVNRDITDGIDAEYAALVGRAPAAPPAGPGGAAVAKTLPTDWAKQLWDWIDNTYGQARQTGLLETTQDGEWAAAKLTDVGIDRDTIRRWYSHLHQYHQRATRAMGWHGVPPRTWGLQRYILCNTDCDLLPTVLLHCPTASADTRPRRCYQSIHVEPNRRGTLR